MNPAQRQQLLLILAGAVVGLFLVDRLVFTPLAAGWRERSETIAGLRESIEKGRLMIDREEFTRRAWNDLRKNTLPASVSHAEKTLLEAFDQWSRDSRVTVSSIKPQWKRGANEDYSLLECRVDASGDLERLAKFLHAVERSDMALRIESVELTARDSDGQNLAMGLMVSGLRLQPLEAN
ncbi:MAG TPA: hypothetical protein DCY13_01900 [Verrucomicrobiales bacterium]|nr:hypothetical protein [Verrucomicrobiales bacterium]